MITAPRPDADVPTAGQVPDDDGETIVRGGD